jgi:hypothetical protein
MIQLEDELFDKHQSFAANPLLLNMMLLTFENYAKIPEKLHIFYSNAFETMYYKHDATKGTYKRELSSNLSDDVFKNTFAKFCFITYYNNKIEFSYEELKEYIKNSSCVDDFNERAYIEDLQCALCVIYVEGLNCKFVHRSFQEYFTAVYIKELPDEQQELFCNRLISTDKNNRFYNDQVFPMLFDMAQSRFENNIILPILNKVESEFDKDANQYEAYLKTILCRFEVTRNKESDGLSRTRFYYDLDNLTMFLLYICYKSYFKCSQDYLDFIHNNWFSLIAKLKKEERNYVHSKEDDETKEYYDFDIIQKNEKLYSILNKSQVGEFAVQMSNLKKEINDKQVNSISDLEKILKLN